MEDETNKGCSMKKIMSFAAAAACGVMALAACSSGGGTAPAEEEQSPTEETAGAEAESADPSGDSYVIGVSVLMDHPSLTAAVEGFKAALEESGIDATINEQSANGDQSTAAAIAGTFKEGNVDLVLAVATPSAQAAAQAITDVPILFTAVTDPVDAGLVETLEVPGGNVTGTTDANPVEEQLALIQEIVPDAKTVGIVYSPGEANSVVQVEWAKEAAQGLGLEIVESPATTSQDVLQATEALSDVDAIYIPTDNVVVSSLETVLQVGESKQIPVFGAEGDTVERGAIGTYGLDYYKLGYQTGLMAVEILENGADPSTMAVESLAEPSLYLNPPAAERMGVQISADLLEQAPPENIFE